MTIAHQSYIVRCNDALKFNPGELWIDDEEELWEVERVLTATSISVRRASAWNQFNYAPWSFIMKAIANFKIGRWTVADHWKNIIYHNNTKLFLNAFFPALGWSLGLLPLALVITQ